MNAGISQGENNYWYFNNGLGLNFNSNPPIVLENGQITSRLEGVATVSDSNGNLLFYSDGITIWDRNHDVMPNGSRLAGSYTSTQSVLIVPFPNDFKKFYVFTTPNHGRTEGGFRYSVVDLELNEGNGDVIISSKNTLLATDITEKLTAAKGLCGQIWVLIHEKNNNHFLAFEITETGISDPVISTVGSPHISGSDGPTAMTGQMKFSPNYNKLALATLTGIVELFDFDRKTGIVSNPVFLSTDTLDSEIFSAYGISFSPNSELLYVNEGIARPTPLENLVRLYQYDISSDNPQIIIESKTLVGAPEREDHIVFDIQMGPDSILYVPRRNRNYLGAILSPNEVGISCNYIDTAIFLGDDNLFDRSNLQNWVVVSDQTNVPDLPLFGADTTLCDDDNLLLEVDTSIDNTLYLWNNGSTDPTQMIDQPGIYWVDLTIGECVYSDTITVEYASDELNLGSDTTLCSGEFVILDATTPGAGYLWQDGSTMPIYTTNQEGSYWVEVNVGNCSYSDTIEIVEKSLDVNLGEDVFLCENDSIFLDVSVPNAQYRWQDNSTFPYLSVSDAGTYWVEVTSGNCIDSDTVNVTYQNLDLDLGRDTILCADQILLLEPSIPGATLLWEDQSNDPVREITTPGTYWIEATLNDCMETDTIQIDYQSFTVNLGSDTTLCEGESLLLDAGMQDADYEWQDQSTGPSIELFDPGEYWVNVTVDGCSESDSVIVSFVEFNVDLGADTVLCEEEQIVLDATTPDASYLWQDNSTNPMLEISQTGSYWVEVMVDRCSMSDTIEVDYQRLAIDLGPDTAICPGESLAIGGEIENAGYLWNDGFTGPIREVDQPGNYSVRVIFNGCEATDSIVVEESSDCMQTSIYIPNIFAPAGDGDNSEFRVFSNDVLDEYSLEIYSRWGNRVFSSTNPEERWDGTFRGERSPVGVYVVMFSYKEHSDSEWIIQTGNVTLIR